MIRLTRPRKLFRSPSFRKITYHPSPRVATWYSASAKIIRCRCLVCFHQRPCCSGCCTRKEISITRLLLFTWSALHMAPLITFYRCPGRPFFIYHWMATNQWKVAWYFSQSFMLKSIILFKLSTTQKASDDETAWCSSFVNCGVYGRSVSWVPIRQKPSAG